MKELNPILTEDNLSTKNEIIETKNSIDDNQFKNTSKNLKRLKPLIKGVKNSVKLVRRISNARLLNYVNILESVNRKGKIRKEEKFNLNQKGIIELAQQHSLSNRPLKVLKDPTELNDDTRAIKYCVCCNLPSITPNIFDTFKMCDNTDLYSVLGEAISLYFSYFKFCIFILFVALCILIVPSFYMINKYHSSLEKMCENIRDKKYTLCDTVNTTKLGRYSQILITDDITPNITIDFSKPELTDCKEFDVIVLAEQTNYGKLSVLSPVYNSRGEYSDDESKSTDGDKPGEGSSNIGLIIVVVILSVILIGGGVAAFFIIRKYKSKGVVITDGKATSMAMLGSTQSDKLVESQAVAE